MSALVGLVFATGAYPLGRAWRANRRTSLRYAVCWAVAAWLAWGGVIVADDLELTGARHAIRYLALCLTGCAGIAVLGARRPGVEAWNLVLAGLLAILLLPLAEGFLTGTIVPNGAIRLFFLGVTVAVGMINYLPTRQAPAALLLSWLCASAWAELAAPALPVLPESIFQLGLALVPWVAWILARRELSTVSELDRLWLDFRDRFGLVWGQRLREQFNHAAAHADWPVSLRWHGFQTNAGAAPADPAAVRTTLLALMKRFGASEDQ